jgi:hypothetical protein
MILRFHVAGSVALTLFRNEKYTIKNKIKIKIKIKTKQ